MDELKIAAAIVLTKIMGTDEGLIDATSGPELGEPQFNLDKVADRYWKIYNVLSSKAPG